MAESLGDAWLIESKDGSVDVSSTICCCKTCSMKSFGCSVNCRLIILPTLAELDLPFTWLSLPSPKSHSCRLILAITILLIFPSQS